MARGKFQLSAAHYFAGDIYLDSGTLVGDDTPYPFDGPPSFNMIPLDPIAQAAWDEENKDGKPKPEMPANIVGPTGHNPAQGPRIQRGTVSAPGGVHGAQGLAAPPVPVTSVEMAKALAVQAALIPKEELDKAIEVERAKQADEKAAKDAVADREAALAKAKEAEKAEAGQAPKVPPPPPFLGEAPKPKTKS